MAHLRVDAGDADLVEVVDGLQRSLTAAFGQRIRLRGEGGAQSGRSAEGEVRLDDMLGSSQAYGPVASTAGVVGSGVTAKWMGPEGHAGSVDVDTIGGADRVTGGRGDVDLFSDRLIRAYVDDDRRFVERPWLAERVNAELASPDRRIVLLTGEPGSGKTAFMAWLARRTPDSLRYFIRRDSRTPLNAGDARSLLLSLGHQLAHRRPELFRPDKLEVVVSQRVDVVEAGGRATGIRVADLVASPFYTTSLQMLQSAGRVAGELAGITVGRMVVEERLLDPDLLQFLALLDPATLLERLEPGARILILIDALDELRHHAVSPSALDWLAGCPPLPATVRIVVASRPDDELLALLRARQAPWLGEVELGVGSEPARRDGGRFAGAWATEPLPAALLADEGVAPDTFAQRAAAVADGNFQFLVALTRGIETAGATPQRAALVRMERVPGELDELYAFFLAVLRDAIRDERVGLGLAGDEGYVTAWQGVYRPILGVLAVARAPLTHAEIAALGPSGVDPATVAEALARLGQFLDHTDGGVALYHESFAEYLTSATTGDTRPGDFVDPAGWNLRVGTRAAAWLDNSISDGMRLYALTHVPGHLAEAIRATSDGAERANIAQQLDELLGNLDFVERKIGELGVDALQADLRAVPALGRSPAVAALAWSLRREAHALRAYADAETPAFIAQQLLNATLPIAAESLAVGARRRLAERGLAYFELRWSAPRPSPALRGVLAGHRDVVRAAAISGDGRRALTGSLDATVRIWDVDTGVCLHVLRDHDGPVWTVDATADWRLAVSGSGDETMRVWDLETGACRHVVKRQDGPVLRVAVATAARAAVSFGSYGPVRVWDLETGARRSVLGRGAPPPLSVAIAEDGDAVVCGYGDGTVRVWDLDSGACRHLSGHKGPVNTIAVSSTNGLIVSGSEDSTVRIWDLATGRCRHVLAADAGAVFAVAAAAKASVAASTSADLAVRVWDLTTGRCLHTLSGHRLGVRALALSADGETAVSGGFDGGRVWDLTTGACRQVWDDADEATVLALSSDGSTAISANTFAPTIWDVRIDDRTGAVAGHEHRVVGVAVEDSERLGMSASQDGTVRLWELDTGRCRHVLAGHGQLLKVWPAGDELLALSREGTVHAWDPRTGQCRRVLPVGEPGVPVDSAALSGDGRVAAVCSYGGSVAIWDLVSGERRHVLAGHRRSVAAAVLSADGSVGVTSSYDQTIRVWSLASGECLRVVPNPQPPDPLAESLALTLTADGEVVSAASDGSLRVWNLDTGECRLTLAGHSDAIRQVVVAAAAPVAVSTSRDGTVRVWDLDAGRQMHCLEGHASWVRALALSGDGRRLLAADNSTLRWWDVDAGRQVGLIPMRIANCLAPFGDRVLVGTDFGHVTCFRCVDAE